jgi:type I restriction enzyme M protein
MMSSDRASLSEAIRRCLREGPEQQQVVGPLVEYLVFECGWDLGQIFFGSREWRVPHNPSEASKRQEGRKYRGYPVDICVFASPDRAGDPRSVLFMVETKQPNEQAGLDQLYIYLSLEPAARLGVWTNSADPSAPAMFVWRNDDGTMSPQRQHVRDLPRCGMQLAPQVMIPRYDDLISPTEGTLRMVLSDLLDKVVARDACVTRREEQLDKLCTLLLLKLESDRQARMQRHEPVRFRPYESEQATARQMHRMLEALADAEPDIFPEPDDRVLGFEEWTIHTCVEALFRFRLLGMELATLSTAFQILRSEALKQREGQFFTPLQVIEAALKLLPPSYSDLIIDPACGTGGFLLEAIREFRRRYPDGLDTDVTAWAQQHVYGIDKDAVAIKLAKAVMRIAGDGAAHCFRGDSLRPRSWRRLWPKLAQECHDGRFSMVLTNPPFGRNLTMSARDMRLEGYTIGLSGGRQVDVPLGLVFLERAYQLLKTDGIVGIVLPETYFFSAEYKYVWEWLRERMTPRVVLNIPMEAFQGFCRAKTSFYVFQKRAPRDDDEVLVLNPQTCGIYKGGKPRFRRDSEGRITTEIDNEMLEYAMQAAREKETGELPPRARRVAVGEVFRKQVLSPNYYDPTYERELTQFLNELGVHALSLGELHDQGVLHVRHGHGSPPNDVRSGEIPYIKVSDLRALRVNINPTNMVPADVARRLWRGATSGLSPWDLITPARASSNIGEFVILLPGEETIVLTKEVLVLRVRKCAGYEWLDPFYLLWALSLRPIRQQWRRVTLLQTNREDIGERWREILIPHPPSTEWARNMSEPFRRMFRTLEKSYAVFREEVAKQGLPYISSVYCHGTAQAMSSEQDAAEQDGESGEMEATDQTL